MILLIKRKEKFRLMEYMIFQEIMAGWSLSVSRSVSVGISSDTSEFAVNRAIYI